MRVTLVVLASVAAAAPAAAFAAPTPVTVYLERNGQTVTARSGDEVAIPRFGGGDRAWTQLVACVKDRFSPFQVTITDRAPGRGDHITALVGGKASMLGLSDRTTNGIGPYSGEVIPNATVHIFSQVGTGERDIDNLCAVTSHEIGHSLGLDHSHLCGDVMSYYNDECGTQQFLDADAPCGETADRDCSNGDATQNSYRRLVSLVGLRPGAPRTGPRPPSTAPMTDDDSLDASDDGDDSSADASDGGDDSSADADESDDGSPAIDDAATDSTTTAPQADPSDAFADDDADAGDDADDSEDPATTTAPDPDESDEADEPPARRWRGGAREGRRGRGQRTQDEQPHCGE